MRLPVLSLLKSVLRQYHLPSLLSVVVAGLLMGLVGVVNGGDMAKPGALGSHLRSTTQSKTAAASSSSATQSYIVTFSEPGVLHYQGGLPSLNATTPEAQRAASPNANASSKFDVHDSAVVAYREYLKGEQQRHLELIKASLGHELITHHFYDIIQSGVSLELSAAEADVVAGLAGIDSVTAVHSYPLDTFRGPSFIGADQIWNGAAVAGGAGNRGEGITIAVLDSGYNSGHPSFGPLPAMCGGDGTRAKVLSAVDCTDSACPGVADGGDPEDHGGHGSHTASTAAGNTLTSLSSSTTTPAPSIPAGFSSISGVAPCAFLRIYKVCLADGCSSDAVLAAQEMAIADAVDVISFSISGGTNPWSRTADTEMGFLDAVHAGILVAASAGNTRPAPPSGTGPANPVGQVNHRGPWVLTVAASTHDLISIFAGSISATGPGTPPVATLNIGLSASNDPLMIATAAGVSLKNFPTNANGCTAAGAYPAGYFTGAIALISRGSCPFAEKVSNAAAAGATAAIVYNNVAGPLNGMGGLSSSTIPAYGITQSSGNALITYLNANGNQITINVESAPTPPQGDVLADFSLRGPNINQPASTVTVTGRGMVRIPAMVGFDVTKPDITGPGVNIYAASTTDEPDPADPTANPKDYAYLSGTSMSAPHLAGAMALVRGAHSEWSPAELMSALRLTAYSGSGSSPRRGTQEDGATPWNPDDVGNGRVDLSKAALATIVMDETYAHFVAANPALAGGDPKTLNLPAVRNTNCLVSCSWTRTLKSALYTRAEWSLQSITDAVTADGVTVAHISLSPVRGTLEARGAFGGGDTQVITITATPTTATLGDIGFADIVLQSDMPGAPPEHITVAVNGMTANRAPTISAVPASITATEDTPTHLTGIHFDDPDAGSADVTATFAMTSSGGPAGTLTATAITGVAVTGSGTGSIALTGSLANINAFIDANHLDYTTAADATYDATVNITIDDLGHSGAGGALSAHAYVPLHVTAVNDAPTITAPASLSITEDITTALTGISFADVDAGSSTVTARFYATPAFASGALTTTFGTGVSVLSGEGTADLSLSGNIASINAFLAGNHLRYTTALNITDDVTLRIEINDNGNSGSGGAHLASRDVVLHFMAVNDAPTIAGTPGPITVIEDALSPISGFSFADVDAGMADVTASFTVTSGTLSATTTLSGVTVGGTGSTLTLTGRIDNISAFIAAGNLHYLTAANAISDVTLHLVINDNGNSGSGPSGGLSNSRDILLIVAAVNDPPTISASASVPVLENAASSISGISFADVDAGSSGVTATFSVPAGTLMATSASGIAVSGIPSSVVLDGNLASINAFIAAGALEYTTALDATGDVRLTITIDDNGNSGGGGHQSASTTTTLHVTAANHPPTMTVPISISVTEDSASPLTGIVFADPDAGAGTVMATFALDSGVLRANSGSGVTVDGTLGSLNLTGSLADINAFIAAGNLNFTTSLNSIGDVPMTVTINDLGNSGYGGPRSATQTVTLLVTAVNDPPNVFALPTLSIASHGSTRLHGISFADVDAGSASMTVTYSVSLGVLTATPASGVTVSGSGTSTLTLSGSLGKLNAFVSTGTGVYYDLATSFYGSTSLIVTINDHGNTGSGGDQLGSATVSLSAIDGLFADGFD